MECKMCKKGKIITELKCQACGVCWHEDIETDLNKKINLVNNMLEFLKEQSK